VRETYLITGGAGFIGSHLTEALLDRGSRVLVLDDLSTGSLRNLAGVASDSNLDVEVGSVLDEVKVDRLVHRADVVVHLAAAVGVRLIIERPVHTIETNVRGTEVVLSAAARAARRVLLASTSEVYGKSARVPFREDDDLVLGATAHSRWAYACSKALDEWLAFAYVREHVYKPAGMINSDAYELDRVNHNLAIGYEREETPRGVEYRNNIFEHVIRGGPAGGGYSTVDDLTLFAEALKAGRLVSTASVRLLTTPKPELNSPTYGFGFIIDEGGRIVGHNGGFNGINSQLDIYEGEPYTFAVMSNYGGGAQRVADKVRTLVLAGRGSNRADKT